MSTRKLVFFSGAAILPSRSTWAHEKARRLAGLEVRDVEGSMPVVLALFSGPARYGSCHPGTKRLD